MRNSNWAGILENRTGPRLSLSAELLSKLITARTGNGAATALPTGATKAVFLTPGDKLVYDLNGNRKADRGETTLLNMTRSLAIAFCTDVNTDLSRGQTPRSETNAKIQGRAQGRSMHYLLASHCATTCQAGNATVKAAGFT